MTDDFIVDLKGYILMEHRFPREAWCDPDDVQAALDEIERLRAALRLLTAWHDDTGVVMLPVLIDVARAALEGKKTND
jgi:hypothetical protein